MQGLRLVQLIKPIQMYNLSELIKTDCCIDCGTNEKLREVVAGFKFPIQPCVAQITLGINKADTHICFDRMFYITINPNFQPVYNTIPLTSINIDL